MRSLDRRTGFDPALKNFLGRDAGFGEFIFVNHKADAGFFGGERNDPEPFVFKADDNSVRFGFAGIEADIFKMAEDGELFPGWVYLAQIFLVAGQITASAGINQKCPAEIMSFSVGIARFDIYAIGIRNKFADRPAFAHIRARRARVLEQNVIERRALDLDGFRLAVKFALPKNKARVDGTVAQSELCAEFSRPETPRCL